MAVMDGFLEDLQQYPQWGVLLPQTMSEEMDHLKVYVLGMCSRTDYYAKCSEGLENLGFPSPKTAMRCLHILKTALAFLAARKLREAIKLCEQCAAVLEPKHYPFCAKLAAISQAQCLLSFRKFPEAERLLEHALPSQDAGPAAQVVGAAAQHLLAQLHLGRDSVQLAAQHGDVACRLYEQYIWQASSETKSSQAAVLATALVQRGVCEQRLGQSGLKWHQRALELCAHLDAEHPLQDVRLHVSTAQAVLAESGEEPAPKGPSAAVASHQYAQPAVEWGFAWTAPTGYDQQSRFDLGDRKWQRALADPAPFNKLLAAAQQPAAQQCAAELPEACRCFVFGPRARNAHRVASASVGRGGVALIWRLLTKLGAAPSLVSVCHQTASTLHGSFGLPCTAITPRAAPTAEAVLAALAALEAGTVVVLPLVSFWPLGEHWARVLSVLAEKRLVPIFDASFLGMGEALSVEQDLLPVRCADVCLPLFAVVLDFALVLPSDTVEVVQVVTQTSQSCRAVQRCLDEDAAALVVPTWPRKLLAAAVSDPSLSKLLVEEMQDLGKRCRRRRQSVLARLDELKAPPFGFQWASLANHAGPWLWTPLDRAAVDFVNAGGEVRVPPSGLLSLLSFGFEADRMCEQLRDALLFHFHQQAERDAKDKHAAQHGVYGSRTEDPSSRRQSAGIDREHKPLPASEPHPLPSPLVAVPCV